MANVLVIQEAEGAKYYYSAKDFVLEKLLHKFQKACPKSLGFTFNDDCLPRHSLYQFVHWICQFQGFILVRGREVTEDRLNA